MSAGSDRARRDIRSPFFCDARRRPSAALHYVPARSSTASNSAAPLRHRSSLMIEFTRRRVRLCYDPRMNVVRIVQFTDPHLYGDEAGKLRGVATYPALVAAIAHARARDWPPNA